MKQTTIKRFHEWAKTHADHEVFSAGTESWTKQEFEAEILGVKHKKTAKPINTDIEIITDKDYADLESTHSPGRSEESGE